MAKAYFISDAHLGMGRPEEERAKEDRLVEFLDIISKDATHLFIVGDLFDAWIEYRTVIPKGFHCILSKLDELVRKGIMIHFLPGNHDYWIRDYFRDHLGMKIYHSAFDITIDGKKLYIHHGDGLANHDAGYKIVKKILHNHFAIWLFSWLHPDMGIALARLSSKRSRQHTSNKHFGEKDGMMEFAKRKIREGYDIIIMGHNHQPIYQEIEHGIYLNLGDWISHCTYVEMNNGCCVLKQWKN